MDPILEHHYHNIAHGKAVENEDGTLSTVKTIIVEIDGVQTIIPTVWDGKIVDNKTAIDNAIASGVNWDTAYGDNAVKTLEQEDKERHEKMTDETSPEEAKKILAEYYSELYEEDNTSVGDVVKSFGKAAASVGLLGAEKLGIDTSRIINWYKGGDSYSDGGLALSDADKNWLVNLPPSYDYSDDEEIEEISSVQIYNSLRPRAKPEEPVISTTTGMVGVDEEGNLIEYGIDSYSEGGFLTKGDGMKGRSEEDKEIADEVEQVDVSEADRNNDGFVSPSEREVQLALQENEVVDEEQLENLSAMQDSEEEPVEAACGGMMGYDPMMTGYDEVSGNAIPLGSTAENVRDDIPANLSTDEYVLPAHVVKWHGLKHIMDMQQEAEMGLMSMEMNGLIHEVYNEEESYSEGSEDPEISTTYNSEQEEAETQGETSEEIPLEEMDIEVAPVMVDNHLTDEVEESYPMSQPLPAIMKKQKIVFAV